MGKSIRIYLADGNAIGIRHAEIVNWTGQALACPRSRFADLREWPEVKRPGVYFLFGTDEQSQEPMAYIGEAEVVLDRVATHLSQKAFWSELVAFTNKDENLTKSHVRYLEARLISQALSARRYTLENTTSPQVPLLPRPDRDAMEEYLDSVRTLLGALGHRILEPLLDQPGEVPPRSDGAPPQNTLPVEAGPGERAAIVVWPPRRDMYQLKVSGILATAMQTDEGLVVVAGSQAAASDQPSLSNGYRALRQKLLDQGVLEKDGAVLRFSRNQRFASPSQAAAVIVGYAINGRKEWRLADGRTLADREQQVSAELLRDLARESDG